MTHPGAAAAVAAVPRLNGPLGPLQPAAVVQHWRWKRGQRCAPSFVGGFGAPRAGPRDMSRPEASRRTDRGLWRWRRATVASEQPGRALPRRRDGVRSAVVVRHVDIAPLGQEPHQAVDVARSCRRAEQLRRLCALDGGAVRPEERRHSLVSILRRVLQRCLAPPVKDIDECGGRSQQRPPPRASGRGWRQRAAPSSRRSLQRLDQRPWLGTATPRPRRRVPPTQ